MRAYAFSANDFNSCGNRWIWFNKCPFSRSIVGLWFHYINTYTRSPHSVHGLNVNVMEASAIYRSIFFVYHSMAFIFPLVQFLFGPHTHTHSHTPCIPCSAVRFVFCFREKSGKASNIFLIIWDWLTENRFSPLRVSVFKHLHSTVWILYNEHMQMHECACLLAHIPLNFIWTAKLRRLYSVSLNSWVTYSSGFQCVIYCTKLLLLWLCCCWSYYTHANACTYTPSTCKRFLVLFYVHATFSHSILIYYKWYIHT